MKTSIIFLLYINICVFAFSQSAYKDYRWGMSVEQVKSISSDLILYKDDEYIKEWYGDEVPIKIYRGDFNVLGVYLNCLIDDRIYIPDMEPNINNIYYSREASLRFYFEEGKCVILNY
jgi:hypothetical protein